MATNVNPLMALGGQQEQQYQPGPDEQEQQPQAIDPSDGLPADILNRQYKLKLAGSRRLVTRDRQRELLQWLCQFLMNAQVMESMASIGQKINIPEILLAAKDATGIEWPYEFVSPLTPQEQQARQQPPPQVVAQQQMKQQDLQAKQALMESKQASDEKIAKMQADVKTLEISEESAWRIADILQREREAAMKVEDPNMKMQLQEQELQMKQRKGDQDLQLQREKHGMTMQQLVQKNQVDAQMGQQKIQLGQLQGAMGLHQQQQTHEANLDQMKEKSAAMKALSGNGVSKSRPKSKR